VAPRLRLPVAAAGSPLAFAASLLAHLGTAFTVAVAGSAASDTNPWDEAESSRLTLIAPENTSPPPSTAQVAAQTTRGDDGTSTATRESDRGALRAGSRAAEAGDAPSAASEAMNSANVLGAEAQVSRIYRMIEVDSAAERDPTSGAPIYPEALQRRGIEGWVTLQFVVDTLGYVELGSVRVVSTTSSAFTAAVLEAVPQMRYRPALRAGRPVRQEAEQVIRFQVARFHRAALP